MSGVVVVSGQRPALSSELVVAEDMRDMQPGGRNYKHRQS